MDDQTHTLTQQAQAGVARVPWQQVLTTAAGLSTMGILLGAGLAPFVTALGVGTLESAPVAQWLVGLGGNVIAGWFGDTALALTREGIAPNTEMIVALAQRLDALAATDAAVREEMAQIVNEIGAIPAMSATMQCIQEEQGAQSEVLLEVYRRLETLHTEIHNELPALRPAIDKAQQQIIATFQSQLATNQSELLAALARQDTALWEQIAHLIKLTQDQWSNLHRLVDHATGSLTIRHVRVGGDYAEGNIDKRQGTFVTIAPLHPPSPEEIAKAQSRFTILINLAADPHRPIPVPTTLPAPSRVFGQRNPHFVGRESDLRTLARLIAGGAGATHIGQSVAVTGLGGMGKTNLAIEFAYCYGQFFHGGVFILSFADAAGVAQEVVACGERMGLYPAGIDMTAEQRVERVIAAWQQPLPRLLIFDNCEDEPLFQEWYQRINGGGCRVLLTARRGVWSKALGIQTHALGVLAREESIALLVKHRPDLAKHPALDAIAEELGDLPLALHLAGSYLGTFVDDDQFGDPKVFLDELRDTNLLDHDALKGIDTTPSPTNHELHLGKTFALSMNRLDNGREPDATALRLLARATCFAAGAWIGRDLLIATLGMEQDDTAGARTATRALNLLVGLGLIDRDAAQGLRIHRLLAAFVQRQITDASAAREVEGVLQYALSAASKTSDPRNLVGLWPHLHHVLDRVGNRDDADLATLLNNMGYAYNMQGDYVAALPLLQRALAICEQVLGPTHPTTATSLNNLANLYHAQGEYEAALPLYQRALAIVEQVLGPTHPDTATSLNNLAGLYESQGVYAQALPLYQQALAIREQVLGPTHSATATSLNNLAGLYASQGNYSSALPLLQRALAICEQVLGPTHPTTATTLNSIAVLYHAQGKYEAALPLCQRALAIFEQVLGPTHPDTTTSLNNLAELYRAQGGYAQALPLNQQALAIREQVLGPTRPDTATSLDSMANLYCAQGKYEAALPLYQQALAIREQMLGSTHPDTATSLNNLAELYRAQGKYEAALPLYQQALVIKEQVLGPTHPQTAMSLHTLAALYRIEGKYEAALPLFEQALAIREQMLGPTHPDTATTLNSIAVLYHAQGDYSSALPLAQRALAINEQTLGLTHPDTATSLNNLAGLYESQGVYAQALPLSERALAIWEQVLGPTHPKIAETLHSIAHIYEALSDLATAEDFLQRAVTILRRHDEEHTRCDAAIYCLENIQAKLAETTRESLLPPPSHILNRSDPRVKFAPFLTEMVRATTDSRLRPQAEASAKRMQSGGWQVYAPILAIWHGERDAATLTAEIDRGSALLITHILALIAEQTM